ncbi:MAG: hypothetical protein ACYCZR_05020, partial [Burkholderiales bacterium]
VTYDQANYHAGQCVALAALDVDDKDLCEALAYQAGLMRGLILAGEPVNSATFRLEYDYMMILRDRALQGRVRTDVHIG